VRYRHDEDVGLDMHEDFAAIWQLLSNLNLSEIKESTSRLDFKSQIVSSLGDVFVFSEAAQLDFWCHEVLETKEVGEECVYYYL